MFKNSKKTAAVHLGLILCSSILLTACQTNGPDAEDDFASTAFYDRYPIKVKKAPVKMGVAAKAGTLRPEQINAVANFAADARNNASSKVSIRWPSGSRGSRQAAYDIAQLFVVQGVPESAIGVGSYPGAASAPIQLSYQRRVAVTKECGDWSDNLAVTGANTQYRNHGCAVQNNIAAMVANPEDFERPRAMSPAAAANRTAAMKVYYELPAASAGSSGSSTSSGTGTGSGG